MIALCVKSIHIMMCGFCAFVFRDYSHGEHERPYMPVPLYPPVPYPMVPAPVGVNFQGGAALTGLWQGVEKGSNMHPGKAVSHSDIHPFATTLSFGQHDRVFFSVSSSSHLFLSSSRRKKKHGEV